MNQRQKHNLIKNRVHIVRDLEPHGSILDCLLEEEVFTENDVEEISSASTRKERCQTLLRLLPRRGPLAYGAFTRALAKNSLDHIADKLAINENEIFEQVTEDICLEYQAFCERVQNDTNPKEMNLAIRALVDGHFSALLENVEPRDLFDCLIRDTVLTEDDVEEIESQGPRRKRCERLVLVLLLKTGSDVIGSLVTAMTKKYKFIVDDINKNTQPQKNAVECFQKSKCANSEAYSTCATDSGCDLTNSTSVGPVLDSIDVSDLNHNTGLAFSRLKSNTAEVDSEHIQYEYINDKADVHVSNVLACKQMTSIPSQGHSRQLSVAFDNLSTLVNQGDFATFDSTTQILTQRFPQNCDLMCIIGYLNACKYLFQANFDEASLNIKTTFDLVPSTSNPRYFTLELLTAKLRMYIIQKKLGKLEAIRDDAIMLMETDPGGNWGRAAGWLYINDAQTMMTQISFLNLSKPNAMQVYNELYLRAKRSLQRSMTNFKNDGGKDGPFGFGFALTRMVILLMRCGNNGNTMNLLKPLPEDIKTAGQIIRHFENSDIELSKILHMLFSLARCDYQYRCHNLTRATEHAQTAFKFASEMNVLEYKDHALNRLRILESKLTIHVRGDFVCEFRESSLASDSEEVSGSDAS